MNTKLFYFSGTGNSLFVAKEVAKLLEGAEIVNIAKAIDEEVVIDADRVGIIYPVYIWGVPQIVKRFIKKIKPEPDKYFFAIATCGGMAGGSLKMLAETMAVQGITLSSGFVVTMPDNYIPWHGADSLEKQNKLFEQAKLKAKEIAEKVEKGKSRNIDKGNFIVNVIGKFVYNLAEPKIKTMDKKFWVDERCNGCTLCAKICPVNNIKMENSKPEWQQRCEHCMACIQWCPQEAIQYGKRTQERKRYKNPLIKVEDLMVYDSF